MDDPLESLSPSERHIWLTTFSARYAEHGSFSYSVDRAWDAVRDFRAWVNKEEIPSEQDDGYPL